MRPPRGRTFAILILLTSISFVGARSALSAVRSVAAPLAGFERLAQPRRIPVADEKAHFSREQFEVSRVTQALEDTVAADPVLVDEPAPDPSTVREGGRSRDFWAELHVGNLSELERELKLTPLQRERIERWLAQEQKAMEALGSSALSDDYSIVLETINDAIRAELDYFQAQEFDRHRQARGYVYGNDITSRPPPPGGYVIGGVGFTEIEEIYVTAEQARSVVYDLKVQTFHTLLRMDPITRSAMFPSYTPANQAADLLEADLLDCHPFTGKQQFTLSRSTK